MTGKCLNPSVYGTLGYSPADWSPSLGGEFNSIPTIFHDKTPNTELDGDAYDGPTFWKLPQFGYPTEQQKEPYLLDPRTYNKDVYNDMVRLFTTAGGGASKADFANHFPNVSKASFHMTANPTSDPRFRVRYKPLNGGANIDINMDAPMTVSREYLQVDGSGSDVDPIETNIYYEWTAERKWSRYAKTVRRGSELRLQSVDESEAPPSMHALEYTAGLKGRAAYSPHSQHASERFDATCFECTNPSVCEQQVRTVTTESGAVVAYRWWRWRDQPSMVALTREFPQRYTEAYLSFMQERIEWMHEHWDPTAEQPHDFFLKRPKALKHVAELERVLVISQPPEGVPARGWVPISLSEMFPPEAMVNGAAADGGRHEKGW